MKRQSRMMMGLKTFMGIVKRQNPKPKATTTSTWTIHKLSLTTFLKARAIRDWAACNWCNRFWVPTIKRKKTKGQNRKVRWIAQGRRYSQLMRTPTKTKASLATTSTKMTWKEPPRLSTWMKLIYTPHKPTKYKAPGATIWRLFIIQVMN